MEAVTITNISPEELEALISNSIQRAIAAQQADEPAVAADKWMDIVELSQYLPDRPTIPTIYGYVHRRTIPFHKRMKKLYFLKSEIDEWLRSGRRSTMEEMVRETEKHLRKKRA